MRTSQFLTVLAAAGFASAQTKTCTKQLNITVPTPSIDCEVVKANVVVDPSVAGDLVLEGPKQIQGDLIINNASINSVSSTSINAISGKFVLEGCQFLKTLRMGSLTDVQEIQFINLAQLEGLAFGSSGKLEINKITISDTFIDDLTGLSVVTVEDFLINNNQRMVAFKSDLANITGQVGLRIEGNGKEFQLDLPKLTTATELQLQDIKSIKLPSLQKLNASLKLDDNRELTEFSAPNLTSVGEAVSLINNVKFSNISFPQLTSIGGDLTVLNNTAMQQLSGFPKLKTIGGGMRLGGNFKDVELPSLKDVKGAANVTSTTDISDFCDFFSKGASNGMIQGAAKCTSNNKQALEGGDGGQSSGSGNKSEKDAAGITNVNMAVLSLAVVFGIAQLL